MLDSWRSKITQQNPPGVYRFVLLFLSQSAKQSLVKVDAELRLDLMRQTGIDAKELQVIMQRASRERLVRLWRSRTTSEDVVVELI